MSKTSVLNDLTDEQRDLLLQLFKDCIEFYPSRKSFDRDFKRLKVATLQELYVGWKAFNASLVTYSPLPNVPVMVEFPFDIHTATSNRVRAIRQVLGLYTRLEGFCDPISALDAYRHRVSGARARCPGVYATIARDLIRSWLGAAPVLMDLHPQHGPGAVAEKYTSLNKCYPEYTFRQLEPFGGESLLYLNENHLAMEPRNLRVLKHPITRVITVPKDFSKPRIISAEPCVMQFLQQGAARYIMAKLEMNCPYINFRDQSVNAKLSRQYSDVATLDMSDASDLVSRRIVRQLFPRDWSDLLFGLRSHFAQLADGTNIPLRAFAPMGSALCFPVESIVFAAISVAAYMVFRGDDRRIDRGKGYLRVYGDDIIVPRDAGEYVMAVLRETGFKPNVSKCCVQGVFRESCGAEWWKGEDVTVVRPRSLNPQSTSIGRHMSLHVMPMAQHANLLYARGFNHAAQCLASYCNFPVALGSGEMYCTPELAWPCVGRLRWNTKLQRAEQEATVPVQVQSPSYVGDTYAGLFLGLASGWRSELVLTPRIKPKRKWVLAAPLADR